jgi:dTDP-4-dehydrorhamnose reductase
MIDRILVFGANGMLGRYIATYFQQQPHYTVIPIIRNDYSVDCTSWAPLDALFQKHGVNKNTCVVNCIGCIPQRYTQSDSSGYYTVNGVFPHVLASFCTKYGAKLIQPTTDCVYSGTRGGYIETDAPDEENHYGRAKAMGEPPSASVLRVSIIGEELENKKSFLEWVRNSQGAVNGWTNHYWNGITCLQYCKVLQKIFEQNLFWKGVRHIFSPEVVSKYDMVCMVNQTYSLGLEVRPTTCTAPVDKTLKTMYSFSEDLAIPPLAQQIAELKAFYLY